MRVDGGRIAHTNSLVGQGEGLYLFMYIHDIVTDEDCWAQSRRPGKEPVGGFSHGSDCYESCDPALPYNGTPEAPKGKRARGLVTHNEAIRNLKGGRLMYPGGILSGPR